MLTGYCRGAEVGFQVLGPASFTLAPLRASSLLSSFPDRPLETVPLGAVGRSMLPSLGPVSVRMVLVAPW